MFEALLPRLWKKTQGHFLTQKLAWQISVDSAQLGKSLRNRHLWPVCTDPLNYFLQNILIALYTIIHRKHEATENLPSMHSSFLLKVLHYPTLKMKCLPGKKMQADLHIA